MPGNHYLNHYKINGLVLAGSAIFIALFLQFSVKLIEILTVQPNTSINDSVPKASLADNLKVILLGSGVGPRIDLRQFGPSILVD